jgi:hypothetical protein
LFGRHALHQRLYVKNQLLDPDRSILHALRYEIVKFLVDACQYRDDVVHPQSIHSLIGLIQVFEQLAVGPVAITHFYRRVKLVGGVGSRTVRVDA